MQITEHKMVSAEDKAVGKKLLVLIRHAKSSWANPELADFDRPLNKRGKRNAPVMGKRLDKLELFPDLFLSSPAKRARKTARKIAGSMGFAKKIVQYDPNLYHASEQEMLHIIRGTAKKVDTLFIVGHNFTLTDLACELAGVEIENIPTCGIVGIEFSRSWEKIRYGSGTLQFFDYPKNESGAVRML